VSSAVATSPATSTWSDRLVFFTWWSRWQNQVEGWPRKRRVTLLIGAVFLGSIAHFWAQTLPPNWDFYQWDNTSTALLEGRDPYVEFGYNYTPIWLLILGSLKWISSDQETFRLLISIVLFLVNIWIVVLLSRRGYSLAAALFILSPIVIAINGQHQQADSIALALALAAMLYANKESAARIVPTDFVAVALLGLSLSVKQIFIVLPLWLAFRPGPIRRRLLYLLVPPAIFAGFLGAGMLAFNPRYVFEEVLLHGSGANSPLVLTLVPHQLAPWVLENRLSLVLSLALLIPAGLLFRRLPPFEMTLVYTVAALLFAWGVANQYLLIPVAAVGVFMNLGFLLWLLGASFYLAGAPYPDGLSLPLLNQAHPHVFLEWFWMGRDLFPYLLLGSVILTFWTRRKGYSPPRA